MITGEGVMVWKSGARYSGQILMNLMDGRGNFSWPNGDQYSGEYINGRSQPHSFFKQTDFHPKYFPQEKWAGGHDLWGW